MGNLFQKLQRHRFAHQISEEQSSELIETNCWCTSSNGDSVSPSLRPSFPNKTSRCKDNKPQKFSSKTIWPIANKQSIFLPVFKIISGDDQKKFILDKVIANGTFGKVHKARKIDKKKEYALKEFDKAQIISENCIEQVKREALIHAAVGHHTFIATAVSHWQTKKKLYLLSEYIAGQELFDLIIEYKTFSEEIARIFLAEIAIALDFLHNAGVIYRDLKPENILVDEDYHIKLIDFGFAKWLSRGRRTHTVCGTPQYIAPEVLSGQGYGHAADWWSLGVLTCLMLTSEFPTQAANIEDKEDKSGASDSRKMHSLESSYREDRIKTPTKLPAAAEKLSASALKLLYRLLDPDPQTRLKSLRQLCQTAFYMAFNMVDVKQKKVSVKNLLPSSYSSGKEV